MTSLAYLGFGKGGHGERAEREPITGIWGRSPQRGPGAEPLVGAEAETLFASECSIETANSPILGQKRTFSYKVACKNFHGRAKGGGGHRTVSPLKYATV